MKTFQYAILVAVALFNYPLIAQNTLHVPSDFPKIQSAIDAAQTGDTVLVAPGIYYENLQLRGRDIVLSSEYYFSTDPVSVIRHTIIDGSQPVHPDTASCLLIWKNETPATVVQGFTFRGGSGTLWLDPAGFGSFREGGGILTEFSSPTIQYNIIRNNTVPHGGPGTVSYGGGGIRSGEGSVHIRNNLIVHNRAEGYGGGIVLNYCPGAVVENNIIAFNYGGKDYSGGGFWATGQNQNTINILRNNTIAYNQSPTAAGQYGGKGGGVWIFSITLQAENNIVWGNSQASGKEIGHSGASLQLNHNCVEGGFGGLNTISANPMFRDTIGFILEAGSPAIDAGIGDAAYLDRSLNGRSAAFPARGARICDLGAYGGANTANPACPASFLQPTVFSSVLNSPVTTTPGDSRSVNWVDIDNDTDLDLFISNGPQAGENNFLYKNNGAGGFTAITGQPIVADNAPSDGATWADYDNDGNIDCFVVNWYGVNNLCYHNLGNGAFEQITTGAFVNDGGYSETASWGDYDKDGKVDLYVTNSSGNRRNFLYHNNGDGTFSKITSGPMVTDAATSRSVNWTDYDLDGDLDLFVSNENNENEQLYQNNNGTFAKVTGSPLVTAAASTMSSSWGDFDNDGDQDVFLANDQGNDGLFRNDNGTFVKITTGPVVGSGGNSFGSQWADIDNDGDLDLFVTNAFWGAQWNNFLFINQGGGTFIRDTAEIVSKDKGWSYGCAFGDIDRDGDLDLSVANCYNANQPDYLYENHSAENANNWLVIKCIGTISNKSAIGAKVWAHTTVNGQPQIQTREVSAQSGYCGQNQLDVHFGLGKAEKVDSLVIQWPTGVRETYQNLNPNRFIVITENQGITPTTQAPEFTPDLKITPNPFSDSVSITWNMPDWDVVQIDVLDLSGTVLYTRKEHFDAGAQTWHWDGLNGNRGNMPSGAYFVYLHGTRWTASAALIKK